MIRTFRYPLLPNASQQRTLARWLDLCCTLYNAALEQRRDAWRRTKKSLSYIEQTRELTLLRDADTEYRALPAEVGRSPLRRLHRAFQAFFRRCKSGTTPGYPRFRSRDRYDSIDLGRVPVEGHRVRIRKLGWVKFRRYRALRGSIIEARLKRGPSRWWVSIVCDIGPVPKKRPIRSAVGIDVGLNHFAALSNGDLVSNPRHYRKGEALLARRQQSLARKPKGSNGRLKARRLVAKAHEHVRNQRRDFHHKLSRRLVDEHDLIAFEALNVRGISRGLNLAKSVHDAGWSQFTAMLSYKAEDAGGTAVAVDPAYTTQACHRCGSIVAKALGNRIHSCPCGVNMDRDLNAALNILALGRSAVRHSGGPEGLN